MIEEEEFVQFVLASQRVLICAVRKVGSRRGSQSEVLLECEWKRGEEVLRPGWMP